MTDSAATDTSKQNETTVYFQSNRPAPTFFAALKSLLTQPREFFANMPFAVFYGNSLFFASIIIFILTFVAVPFYSLGMLFMLPFTWGCILIGMWALAAFISWGVKAFGGARLTQANAFQVSSYALAPMMFVGLSWGGALAFLWSMYLLWIGLASYCRISGGRAAAVITVPLMIVAMIGGAMMFALGHLKIS
jgi:hypothetical protein